MVEIITIPDLKRLVKQVGMLPFFSQLIDTLKQDFAHWQQFSHSPRHATHYDHGVIEVMPVGGKEFYAFKYVNGHPYNPQDNKLTVTAFGMLSEVKHGYPLLISEMTVLTAFRTAATSALASLYLAKKDSKTLGIIGTGAQAEFQVLAHHVALGINTIKYFDVDAAAMQKFADNLQPYNLQLIACQSAEQVLQDVDIVTTATADKKKATILNDAWIKPGLHINGIGGDCPGKTELDANTLKRCRVVVEYIAQAKQEGEIQHLDINDVHAELWQLVTGEKIGRDSNDDITLFDSVGIALEDYSALRYVYQLSQQFNIGERSELIPDLKDPKNLFGVL